jgi:Flp pilus assembly protein TadD
MLYAISLLTIRPQGAAEEAAKALELKPNEPILMTSVANLSFIAGDVTAARLQAARAEELAPPDFPFRPELTSVQGRLAALDGDDKAAEQAFRVALAHEPGNAAFTSDLAKFLAARGRTPDALGVIDESLNSTAESERLMRLRDEIVDQG